MRKRKNTPTVLRPVPLIPVELSGPLSYDLLQNVRDQENHNLRRKHRTIAELHAMRDEIDRTIAFLNEKK